jgi:hypothetical protein
MLIHEKLRPGAMYPQLTWFSANSYVEFLEAFRDGQTVDRNNLLCTADTPQTHFFKTAITSGHLRHEGSPIQGESLENIFLLPAGAKFLRDKQDETFCRMAADLAPKSIAEDDGELHPYVGAVVVKDGKILATGYRGETGEGRHAEYCALKNMLVNY